MIGRWIFLRERGLSRRNWLALIILLAGALLALFPLRTALDLAGADGRGLSARAVEGTVWSGRIGDLVVGPLPLGTVDAGINPLPLLIGRSEVWLRRPDDAGVGVFSATGTFGSPGLDLRNVNGIVPLAGGMGQLPVSALGFTDFSYRAREGRCAEADGMVTLTLSVPGIAAAGDLAMSGKARCQNGALAITLAGPTGMEKLLLRVKSNGAWTADLTLSGLPPEVATPLLAQGFTGRGDGLTLRATGKF